MKSITLLFISGLFLLVCTWAQAMESSKPSYQKPGLPVRLLAPSLETVHAGDTVPLHYEFLSPLSEGHVVVHVRVDEGLQHTAADAYSFNLGEAPFALDFELSPQQDGVYYIRFMVEMGEQFRALGHRIRVGEPEAEIIQKPHDLSGGIRSMPAQETIKTP